MPDFKKLSLRECADRLLSVEKPLVLMHIRPDGDTVGSAAALMEIFRELGREPLYASADEIPERLAFLLDGSSRAESFEGLTPVGIDIPSPMQLGDLYGKLDVFFTIDHHEVNTPFSDNYTVGSASSAGEVLFDVLRVLVADGKLTVTKRIAERIYAAISSDTGGFAYSNASAKTYADAAELVSFGIDHADINRRLFASKSKSEIVANGIVGANLKTAADGKIAYATISRAERENSSLAFSDFDTAIDVVRALRGSEIAFVIKETDAGQFKASLRSVGKNVAEIAARHSGGGHIRAAGCTIAAETVDGAAKILLDEITAIL